MLWKRVGPRAAAPAATAATAAAAAVPLRPPPPHDRRPSPAPLPQTPAPPLPAVADPEEDGEDGPAQLTRAVSSFGQNRILAMFGSRLATGAGWRR